MNGLTQRNKLGDQHEPLMTDRARRWRAWARAIAGSLPSSGPGITRRRAPLELALRRSRSLFWNLNYNTFAHPATKNIGIVVKPVVRLSLHWTRTSKVWNRSLAPATPGETASAMPATTSGAIRFGSAYLIHRWILPEPQTQSRALPREIVERTRRLEQRMHLEKRLVARGAASSAAIRESQDAAHRTGSDWWKSETPMRSPRTPSSPAINVDQITETVMQRIDQRVSAWRERMGRM